MTQNALAAIAVCIALFTAPAHAGTPENAAEFMDATGFDVAIEGLEQSALAAPMIVGNDNSNFGQTWNKLVTEVFAPAPMVAQAENMIAEIIDDPLLRHGITFYQSPLGLRLLQAENESHLLSDEDKTAAATRLMRDIRENDPQRIPLLRAMANAIGTREASIKAIIEIQVQYILAAQAAGALESGLSEADLRIALEGQRDDIGRSIETNAILSSIFTYRNISNDDLKAYVDALKTPEMTKVYQALNAVQYHIMIDRYTQLGARLDELVEKQDL